MFDSPLEATVAGALHEALIERQVGAQLAIEPSSRLLVCLELFLPALLRQTYPEWRGESLDGIWPAQSERTSDTCLRLHGLVILMSDQTLAPMRLELAHSEDGRELAGIDLALGLRGSGRMGLARAPYGELGRRLGGSAGLGLDEDWAFRFVARS